jgi:hypothetical protein
MVMLLQERCSGLTVLPIAMRALSHNAAARQEPSGVAD